MTSAVLAGVGVLAVVLLARPAVALRVAGVAPVDGSSRPLRPRGTQRSTCWAFVALPIAVAAWWWSPLAALVVTVIGIAVAVRLPRRRRRQRSAQAAAAVVEVVFALAAELRAGIAPAPALEAVAATAGPLRDALVRAAAAVRAGGSPADELRELSRLDGCAGLRPVAAAWQVSERAGGAVADVLDRLGDTLDAEQEARRAMAAALAGPRATMTLLAALPAVGVALGQSLGARPLHLLVHDRLGWLLAIAAGLLDLAGVAWTSTLVRRALG